MKVPLTIAAIMLVTVCPLIGLLTQSWEHFFASVVGIAIYLCIRIVFPIMDNPGQGPGAP